MKAPSLLLPLLLLAACAPAETAQQDAAHTELSPIGPEPAGDPVRHPVVLEHGFAASPEFNGFRGVAEALEADGHRVYVTEAPPFQSALVRASSLAATVDRALADGADKVNIVAHSMGGLDARALISQLGYGDVVATLTTVSTPHGGSRVADLLLGLGGKPSAEDAAAMNDFLRWVGRQFSDVADDADLHAALVDLSEANAAAFAEDNPNDARVVYQSVAGVSSVFGIANELDLQACDYTFYQRENGENAYPGGGGLPDWMTAVLAKVAFSVAHGFELIPNDGLVTVASARLEGSLWLGCVPADHADEIGQFDLDGPDPITGFDHVRFYRNLAFSLAAQGF